MLIPGSSLRFVSTTSLLAAALTLLGCDATVAPSTTGGATSSSAAASTTAAPTATASPTTRAAASSAPVGPHAAIVPVIPTTPEPRPAADAFTDAISLNTADDDVKATQCELRLLGQWLQVDCKAEFMLTVRELDWGKAGEDYVDGSPLYLRLRPGTAQRGHLSPSDKAAVVLNVAWPAGHPKPWAIALEDKGKVARRAAGAQEGVTSLDELQVEPNRPRPAEAEWVRAQPVNSAPLAERPKGCAMHTLDGWLRMSCMANDTLVDLRLLEGFGEAGKDYFRRAAFAGQGVALDLPMRPGHDYKAYVTGDFEHRATLVIEWPDDAPKPSRLSLSTKR